MPRPSRRSKTLRKVSVRTPGSKVSTSFRKRKPSKPICASCKKPLKGVPKARPYQLKKFTKSKRRPQRADGGILCSACSKRKIISEVRKQ